MKRTIGSQRLNMIILPEAEVLWTDSALRQNRGGFGKYQSSAANGAAAKMYEMPIVRGSVGAGVLTHGRDKHAVRECDISNRERIKQMSHG